MSNELNQNWYPEYFSNLDDSVPKFLFRIDCKSPEEVFQKGLVINSKDNFSFFDYFFNIYSCTSSEPEDCYINAFETISEALINFRKNLYAINQKIENLYLYKIRCDEFFFNKQITRLSMAGALIENQIKTKNKNEAKKLIFAFNNYGQKFSNNYEWFTVKNIESNQIFSASYINFIFKKNLNKNSKNINFDIIPEIEETIFRNPNYFDLNTQANKRAFIYPEFLANENIEFKDEVYYFEDTSKIISLINPNHRSFNSNNFIESIKASPVIKKINITDSNNKQKTIKVNFYKEDINDYYYEKFFAQGKHVNFVNKQIKPFNLLFSCEKFLEKTFYLNISSNKKRGRVFFEVKTQSNKNINKVYFDKSGRIIFDSNCNIPFALTVENYDKSKDILEVGSLPATINNINQNFHFEHAYSGFFYLKSSNRLYSHLELAIKHNNNSFVFLNPKRKYNFAFDFVNINLSKYPKKFHNFIYGMNLNILELVNINLNWFWKEQSFKPNVFITYSQEKNNLKIDQSRSVESKIDISNILYCVNNLSILLVDYNNHFKLNTDAFKIDNNFNGVTNYRWIEWSEANLYKYPNFSSMWVLKKARYDRENFYRIISFLNNDYLWIQQKGENWGFFFAAPKKSKPKKSSSLFFLNKSLIK